MKVNVCADGGFLCDQCVYNEQERIDEVDPQCPDDDQWRIIGQQESTDTEVCDHCGQIILRDKEVHITLCPDCAAYVINGVACHEHCCPSSHINLATGKPYLVPCSWCGSPTSAPPYPCDKAFCDNSCAAAYNT